MSDLSSRDQVIEALRKVYDPEIPVNIYDLGLIYEVTLKGAAAEIRMTLTSPNCPVAETLPLDVRDAAVTIDGVESADVKVVWDPTWTPEMMSEAAQLELGMF
jgi:FeS assembly SUF system protein